MNLNPIRAWWAECKLYVLGFIALVLVLTYAWAWWGHGHARYCDGKAAGDKEVAVLKAQYQQAYADAETLAQAQQKQTDAAALAEANARAQAATVQVSKAQGIAASAESSVAAYRAALKKEHNHDPSVDAWLDTVPPVGVRHPSGAG